MSRTTRKDRYDRIYSNKPKDSKGYVCNCHICVGVDRTELKEKISKRELAKELNKDYESEFNEIVKLETMDI